MTISEGLQFVNVLLLPVLYYLHNIDKRITVIETVSDLQSCASCANHLPKSK